MKSDFRDNVQVRAVARTEGDVESVWKGLIDCLLLTAEEVCGRTKSPPRHKETWWWNSKVAKAVKEKGRLFRVWNNSKTAENKCAYGAAKKAASKAVHIAQETEKKKFAVTLDEEDAKKPFHAQVNFGDKKYMLW